MRTLLGIPRRADFFLFVTSGTYKHFGITKSVAVENVQKKKIITKNVDGLPFVKSSGSII